jgi:hypothetical protein
MFSGKLQNMETLVIDENSIFLVEKSVAQKFVIMLKRF